MSDLQYRGILHVYSIHILYIPVMGMTSPFLYQTNRGLGKATAEQLILTESPRTKFCSFGFTDTTGDSESIITKNAD